MLLPIGDAVAISLFAVLGLIRHDSGLTLEGVLRNAVPLVLGWFVAALALEVYAEPEGWRLALAWLLGITLGVALRAVAEGGFSVVFWLVALGVTGALLGVWRGLVALRSR